MNELIHPNEWRRYIWAALVFAVIFVAMEIVPTVSYMQKHEYGGRVIPEAEAERAAADFASGHLGLPVDSAQAVHQTDKLLTGYLSKEKLLEQYEERYDKQLPTDTYQVAVKFADRKGSGFVYVHMYNEAVTAWSFRVGGDIPAAEEQAAAVDSTLKERLSLSDEFEAADGSEKGRWTIFDPGTRIGEASLSASLETRTVNGKTVVTTYKPSFKAPSDYIDYVEKQDRLAGWLVGVGYILMSIILGILAIVYAILYRKHTSFKYGSVLTAIFFITYVIMNLNMIKGLQASQGEQLMDNGFLVFTMILTVMLSVPMAASIYFSLVAGDGLWKAQGRRLWPRLGEPGYGNHVWRSAGLSYLFAVIMLGLQPLIFRGLEFVIGTWSTSDVLMSPYNVSVLWLMPVLAWAAAISEEAVFRLFGIGLFRKWFRHTFAAALLPTFFWALGHVNYPFYPSTTRLIELMIIGLMFSFIFVRYGFITAMFTHAIFNSVAVATMLFMAGSAADMASAVFFMALPVLIAYVLKLWNQKKTAAPV